MNVINRSRLIITLLVVMISGKKFLFGTANCLNHAGTTCAVTNQSCHILNKPNISGPYHKLFLHKNQHGVVDYGNHNIEYLCEQILQLRRDCGTNHYATKQCLEISIIAKALCYSPSVYVYM